MSNLQMVVETYVGKSKELLECEKCLKEIVDAIYIDHENPLNLTRSRSVYREHPACKKLETLLTKFFKVSEIRIFWNTGSINAFTIPASSIITNRRRNTRDFSKAVFNICVYEELVYYAELTETELMAVILHEIGHCFYTSPLMIVDEILSISLLPVKLLVKLIMTGSLNAENFIKKNLPFISNITTLIDDINIQWMSLLKLGIHTFNPMAVIMNMKDPITSIAKYGNERGADSFAAKYGYSVDQASALRKLTRAEGTIGGTIRNDTTLGSIAGDISEITMELFNAMTLDEHPNNDQRVNSMIQKLERDLNTGDFPPTVKKELEMEIKRLKEVHKELNDNDKRVHIKKVYYNVLNTITRNHNDIRELFNKFYIKYEF